MAPDICRGGSRKWNFLGWMKFVSCYQLELYRRIFGSFSFFKREARVLIFYGRGSLLMNFNRSNDTWALIKLDRLSFSVLHLFATFLSFNLCQLYTAYIPWNRIFLVFILERAFFSCQDSKWGETRENSFTMFASNCYVNCLSHFARTINSQNLKKVLQLLFYPPTT